MLIPQTPTRGQVTKLRNVMETVFLFSSLDDEQKQRVADSMASKPVAKGETVIKAGERGDYFYIVAHGIFQALNRNGECVCEYAQQGSFGELALMYVMAR